MGTGVKGDFGNTFGARQSMKGIEGVLYFGDLFDFDYNEFAKGSGIGKPEKEKMQQGYLVIRFVNNEDKQLNVPELFLKDIFSEKNNKDKMIKGFAKDFQQKTRVFSKYNEFYRLGYCKEYYDDAFNHINGNFDYIKSNWYIEQIVSLLYEAIKGELNVEAAFFKN